MILLKSFLLTVIWLQLASGQFANLYPQLGQIAQPSLLDPVQIQNALRNFVDSGALGKLLKGEVKFGQKSKISPIGAQVSAIRGVPQADAIAAIPNPNAFFDDPDFGLKSPLFNTLKEAVIAAVPLVIPPQGFPNNLLATAQNSPAQSAFNPLLPANSGLAGIPQGNGQNVLPSSANNPLSQLFSKFPGSANVQPAIEPQNPAVKPDQVSPINPQIFGGGTLAGGNNPILSPFGTGQFGVPPAAVPTARVPVQTEKPKIQEEHKKPKDDKVTKLNAQKNRANVDASGEGQNDQLHNNPQILQSPQGTPFRLPSFLTVNHKNKNNT